MFADDRTQQRNEAGGNFVQEEEYSIPDEMAGLIIGRGGEQIIRLQAETGCRINIPKSSGDPNRRCTLTGSRDSVEAIKSMIAKIISESGKNVREMMIPGPHVGRLIGKGGENLKALQEKCGVKMVVIQDGPEPTIYEKPLRISGDQENVEFAEQVVTDFLAQKDNKGPQRFFASRPVYREELCSNQEQDNSNFFLKVIIGLIIFLFLGSLTSRS